MAVLYQKITKTLDRMPGYMAYYTRKDTMFKTMGVVFYDEDHGYVKLVYGDLDTAFSILPNGDMVKIRKKKEWKRKLFK